MLIVGTEQRQLIILDQTGLAIKKTFILKAVPCFIQSQGQYDVDHKIYVACRDGKVYVIRNGELSEQIFSIDSKPIGLILFDKQLVIAGMNSTIHSFYLKGKKNFHIQMPSTITSICKLELKRTQSIQCVIVAMNNGEIRMYKEKNLVYSLKSEVRLSDSEVNNNDFQEVVTGLCYGVFGREEGCLIINNKSGGLSAKILQRQANLTSIQKPGPPPEQDIPLNVPKKTKLFVELTQRERENAVCK